jgi:hypothetical protein
MSDLLRIAIDAGLFFITCTVIFVVGFIVDAWLHSKRRAAASKAREGSGVGLAPYGPATASRWDPRPPPRREPGQGEQGRAWVP